MNNSVHFPVEIVFDNEQLYSEAIENNAHKQANKLGKYFDHIMSCKVTLETHRHSKKGNIYHVRIDLAVPNQPLIVDRDPAENDAHKDIYVAIRDAFLAMTKKLKKYVDKQRGSVKHHEIPPEGRILEIAPIADYGFIETDDGRRLRFTSNSVIDFDFSELDVGRKVTFVEARSNDGPAVSTVYVK